MSKKKKELLLNIYTLDSFGIHILSLLIIFLTLCKHLRIKLTKIR